MSASRVERRAKARAQRRNAARLGSAFAIVIALVLAGAIGLHLASLNRSRMGQGAVSRSESGAPPNGAVASDTPTSSADSSPTVGEDFLAYAPIPQSSDATLVEVPDVVGRAAAEAQAFLEAADLNVGGLSASVGSSVHVLSQQPAGGNIVPAGTRVVLVLEGAAPSSGKGAAGKVVVLDPGHQSHADTAEEPVGPGSTMLKARVTGGATGVVTRVPEYEVALEIAMNVRTRLTNAGVKVVMTRTTNDVDLSNAERAKKANSADAALFVRIHADGSADGRVAGIHTLYPAVTKWTKSTSEPSKRAAALVQTAVIAWTTAKNVGVTARSDLAGFNWCTKPSILVECGFLSNSIEDRLLTSPGYQDKVASGIAAGILEYLGS